MSNLAWKDVHWELVNKRLSRQQRRVYKASMQGNKKKVHALQRRIIDSLDAKLVAIRRITTENNGHNTSGLNRQTTISNYAKVKLTFKLKLGEKACAIRPIFIPKTSKNRILPLGTKIEDRAKQMLAELVLEPEWEATFNSNDYIFRPRRSYHDAIKKLFFSLNGKSQYVLDVGIHKCFDQNHHEKLFQKLFSFEIMENQIRAWLKVDIMADYFNKRKIFQSTDGSLKNEVISSILTNIIWYDLENYIKDWYINQWYTLNGLGLDISIRQRKSSIGFFRYAGGFVITAPKITDIKQIKKQVKIWLSEEIGLSLSKGKTRIVDAMKGFEFLGFNFISLKSDAVDQYKLKIYPSKLSKNRLLNQVRETVQQNRSAASYTLINLLIPKIICWADYFRFSDCRKDFSKMDYLVYQQLRTWVFRRKSKGLRARTKLKEKYFPSNKIFLFREKKYSNNWILVGETFLNGEKKENFLPKMVWVCSN